MNKTLRLLSFVLFIFATLILSSVVFVQAQSTATNVCPGGAEQALRALEPNCSTLGRNAACYGFREVDASFNVEVAPDAFDQTDDRIDLLSVNAIRTRRLELDENSWGLSLMHVQANLPDTLPGQGAVFVLFGGIEVEGAVEPEDAIIPNQSYSFLTTADTRLLNVPDEPGWYDTETRANIPAGTTLQIDAISRGAGWVRAVYNDLPGWVRVNDVEGDVSPLPVVGKYTYTPMQAFYFRVGIGGITCEEVPSVLTIQGPRTTEVNLRANEVNFRVSSTAVLRTLPPGDRMGSAFEIITLSGLVTVNPDMPRDIKVPPGYAAWIPMCPEPLSLGIENDADERHHCGPIRLRQLSAAELDELRLVEQIPSSLLYYPIEVPHFDQMSPGLGNAVPVYIVGDQQNFAEVREACFRGQISQEICQQYAINAGVPTPTPTPRASYQEQLLIRP